MKKLFNLLKDDWNYAKTMSEKLYIVFSLSCVLIFIVGITMLFITIPEIAFIVVAGFMTVFGFVHTAILLDRL